jgi:hypothetical protein
MDPMNSIWYYTEFQRQSAQRSSLQDFDKLGRVDLGKLGMEFGPPVIVLAAVIGFGLLCFLFPTFLT